MIGTRQRGGDHLRNVRQIINPYDARSVCDIEPRGKQSQSNRIATVAWCICFFYPFIAVGSVYLSWLVAWIALGHQPREMLNDPKQMGGLMDFAYLISVLLVIPWPVFGVAGFLVSFRCPVPAIGKRFLSMTALAIAYMMICALALGLMRLDPGGVFSWWLD